MSELRRSSQDAIHLHANSEAPVVFTPDDFDLFVLSQREVVAAAADAVARKERVQRVTEAIGAWVSIVHAWCKENGVEACVASPRMDDIVVVIIAPDEDPGGRLHDAMSSLDLDSFKRNGLRFSWILLRASEAAGLPAFVNMKSARTIYRRAHQQAA